MKNRVNVFVEHLNGLDYGKYSIEVVRAPAPEPWRWVVPNHSWVDGRGFLRPKHMAEQVLYFNLYDERGVLLHRVYNSNQVLDYIRRTKVKQEMREEFMKATLRLRRHLYFDVNSNFLWK